MDKEALLLFCLLILWDKKKKKKGKTSQPEQMRKSPDRLKALMRLLPLSKAKQPFQKVMAWHLLEHGDMPNCLY